MAPSAAAVDAAPEDTSPLFFYQTRGTYGPFSQWYKCKITLPPSHFTYLLLPVDKDKDINSTSMQDIISTLPTPLIFNTAEQYMMFAKALLFADLSSATQILAAKAPGQQKKLGRGIKNFKQQVWEAHRSRIVEEASYEKFRQNRGERQVLLGTGQRVLVEASPTDAIWGIGWAAEGAVGNEEVWGLNLLGLALGVARERLRQLEMGGKK